MRRISPRELRRLSQRMGLTLEELEDVEEVIIRLRDKEIVITNAKVSVMSFKGEKIFQIMGEVSEREKTEEVEEKIEIPEEDVQLVAAQTGVSLEEARRALEETGGDLAQAIILLNARRSA